MNPHEILQFLEVLARTSMQAGALVLIILIAQWIFRRQLTPRWRCALWMLVMARLLLPVSLPTEFSIFNFLPTPRAVNATLPTAPGAVLTMPPSVPADPAARMPSVEPMVSATHLTPQSSQLPLSPEPPAIEAASSTGPALIPATRWREVPLWTVVVFSVWLAGVLLLATHVIFVSVSVNRRLRGCRNSKTPS